MPTDQEPGRGAARPTGVRTLILLEELGAPYMLNVINMKAGEQLQPSYLLVNPLGKVPAVRHHGMLVTEQVAIFISPKIQISVRVTY